MIDRVESNLTRKEKEHLAALFEQVRPDVRDSQQDEFCRICDEAVKWLNREGRHEGEMYRPGEDQ